MTALIFHSAHGVAEIHLGYTAEIKIAGGALSAGGPVLAFHTAGAWHVGSQRIERIVCKGAVRVEFQSKAGRTSLGQLDEFSLTADLAMTSQGVVARYRPFEQTWYFDGYDAESDALLVKPVPKLAPA